MIISGCCKADIERAVDEVNKSTGCGNVRIKDFRALNEKTRRNQVTFTVYSSSGKYSRTSVSAFNRGRRVSALCWHGHGAIFDWLLDNVPGVVIRTSPPVASHSQSPVYTAENREFVDWIAGPPISPMYISEACDCEY